MAFQYPDGKRYRSFNGYLQEIFGCRVHKVSLDGGFTCPNRDGRCGLGGCIYCNNRGFSYNTRKGVPPLSQQLQQGITHIRRRFNAKRFIAYFQAYSSTYASLDCLKNTYDTIKSFPEIVGLFISTRPDCLPDDVLELIASYKKKYLTWIELGLQSASDTTLELINRGHTVTDFIDACHRAFNYQLPVCAHIILGLPGETREHMNATAELLAELRISGIKIHALHILKETRLSEEYGLSPFPLLGMSEYAGLVCDVLEKMPPESVVQRLAVDVPRDELVAPLWCLQKKETVGLIETEFEKRDTWQGKLFRDTP